MPTGEAHIHKPFDDQLRILEDSVARMCGLTEAQLANALKALAERDSALAAQVAEGDGAVDALENAVTEEAILVLTLRAPVANDLRQVITALKVAADLERVADHAANTARRALVINQSAPVSPVRTLLRLGREVQGLLREALDSYLTGDAERALAVRARDVEVDELYSSLFREILTYMMEDPRTITLCSHLMFIAKNIERVGDHATNIAEMTYYLSTGHQLASPRPKHDVSSLEGAGPGQ
jgi:phosphate transport system protein